MWSKKEIVIFFVGAQFFHTLSHIFIGIAGILPITFFNIRWTTQLNLWTIVINALITVALYWWSTKLP